MRFKAEGWILFFSACISLLSSETFQFIGTFVSWVINVATNLCIPRGGGLFTSLKPRFSEVINIAASPSDANRTLMKVRISEFVFPLDNSR